MIMPLLREMKNLITKAHTQKKLGYIIDLMRGIDKVPQDEYDPYLELHLMQHGRRGL